MMLYDLGELARLEPRSLEPVLAHKRWFTDVIAYVEELGLSTGTQLCRAASAVCIISAPWALKFEVLGDVLDHVDKLATKMMRVYVAGMNEGKSGASYARHLGSGR